MSTINIANIVRKSYIKGKTGAKLTSVHVSDILEEMPLSNEDKQAVTVKVLNTSNQTGLEDLLSSLTVKDPLEHIASVRDKLSEYFRKSIMAYHYVLDDAIKEARWESINAEIFHTSGLSVTGKSNGSHKSGADLVANNVAYSNKTACYDKKRMSFDISSYRLSAVCSNKDTGDISEIVSEINGRKNFSYYSILVREEKEKAIEYDWYMIPAEFAMLNPSSYEWTQVENKKGKITGWESNEIQGCSMRIAFSMSSQLWITVRTELVKPYLVCSTEVPVGTGIGFIRLHDMLFK